MSTLLDAGQSSIKKKQGEIREATERTEKHASQTLIYSNSLMASSSKTEGNNIFIRQSLHMSKRNIFVID